MAVREISVVPAKAGGWTVAGLGASRKQTYDTKQAAIDAAREMAERKGGAELTIQGRDGAIRERNTIGDPLRVRERRRVDSKAPDPRSGRSSKKSTTGALRTTVTVPADVIEALRAFMAHHPVKLQQALLQLARLGAAEEQRRAEVRRVAEQRRRAVAERAGTPLPGEWPSPDELRDAILVDHDDD